MFENHNSLLNDKRQKYQIMKARLYSSPVITLTESATIDRVLLKMQLNHIKTVVIQSENKPIAVVTERDIVRFLENDKTKRALDEIELSEIMKKNPITITEGQQDHFNQCTMRMKTFKIGAIIVVDDDGNLVGITTKTDITNAFSMLYPGKYKVKDYMSRKVATCRQSDSLKFALNILNRNCISRLVVTDNDGNPEGVITTNTFLRHFSNFKKASSKEADNWNYLKFKIALPVKAILHEDLLTVNEDEDLAKAARLMIDKIVSGLPVVNKKKDLVGLISKSDVVRAFDDVQAHHILLEKYKQTH